MTGNQPEHILIEQTLINSAFLEREVKIDAYLPVNVAEPHKMSLLLINDGQDLPVMRFDYILNKLLLDDEIDPVMCIGIHCGTDRLNEYGTAQYKNFRDQGAKAGLYTQFIFEELLPLLHEKYNVPSFKEKSFAGFSLGGLSALDIVWNRPYEFANVGVFSGSLWWRSKSYSEGYEDDKDRIMHQQIKSGQHWPWLKFFFECGALDEKADRNKNGIIDSIDDTMDLMDELRKIGYKNGSVKYLELPDGKHDVLTWGKAFPAFLKWGWGKNDGMIK